MVKKGTLKEIYEKCLPRIMAIKDFILFALGYGLILNFSFFVLFNFPFKFYTFPAYGIFFYFIKEELTIIIKRIKN